MEKRPIPNSSGILVLGILSIFFGCAIIGLVLGIIGLVLSKDSMRAYHANPDSYTGYSALNAGRIMCIIGIILGGVLLLKLIIAIAIGGAFLGGILDFVN